MRRDDIRELRRANNAAHRTGSMAPVRVADSVGTGSAETYRLIRGLVKEPSGVTAGATFTIDNIEPLAGGLDPSGGTASFELEVDEAKQNYSDNAEVIAIYDPAAANSWVDITDVGAADFRRVKFLVNQSSVTAGAATFTVDNVRPISSGLNPVASTADGVNLTVNDAVKAYTDNDPGYAEWDNDNSEWIDVTDVQGGEGVFYVKFINQTLSGSSDVAAVVQTTSGCSLSDGAEITCCNKTGRPIWANAYAEAFEAEDGTYHAISSDSAWLVRGTAAGDSAPTGFSAVTLSTPAALCGTVLPASISVTNNLDIPIAAGDDVIAVVNASGGWDIVAATPMQPGCGIKYNDASHKEWDVDVDNLFATVECGIEVDYSGDCPIVYVEPTYVYGTSGVNVTKLGCSYAVSIDLQFDECQFVASSQNGGMVQLRLGNCLECTEAYGGIGVSDSCIEQIVNNYFETNIDITVNIQQYFENLNYEEVSVTVLSNCDSITVTETNIEISFSSKTLTFLGRSEDAGTKTCSTEEIEVSCS